ncbi:MFS transporter [Pelistega sp. MC2]|nr:MFS transporter [Pelistega sp. MC2]
MTLQNTINLQELLNSKSYRLQKLIFVLTFLIAFFDGYDTAVIGYIAPSLIQEWGIAKTALTPVLSAALFGLATGAILSGPIADKLGRKWPLIMSVFIFAIGSLISAKAESLRALEIWRFITGIGLGAAMPNAVTLLSEYSADKNRARVVNTMFCGFPLGAALGGFIAAYLIPEYGWRSTLIFGGILPALLGLVMIVYLPESLCYLIALKTKQTAIVKIVQRLNPSLKNTGYYFFEHQQATELSKKGIAIVMSKRYVAGSVLLWLCYFMGLIIFYGVMNWMPTLLGQTTLEPGTAKRLVGLFALGGLGAIASGYLMDRYNPNILNAILALLTAILIAFIGQGLSWGLMILVPIVILAGIVMNTLQASLPAVAALFYPTEGRTTGVSWMMGIGRFGAVAGSYLVAELVKRNYSLEEIFIVLAIPAVIMMFCLLLKQFIYKR